MPQSLESSLSQVWKQTARKQSPIVLVPQGSRGIVLVFAVNVFLMASFAMVHANAGSPIYLGSKTTLSLSMDAIDHQVWDRLLKTYVNDDGLVDYKAWKASIDDVKQLDAYLEMLSSASLSHQATRASKLAFFINAYNAVTVKGILNEYPTTSIRNHTAKLFGYNIWEDLQLFVSGTPLSLEAIEHQVLRKMSEPRIHFAIVCASIGCPRLLNEAYLADKLNEQLDRNAKDFFSRSRNFRYDASSQTFYLSSILNWFGEDFGDSKSARLKKISPWLPAAGGKDQASAGTGSVKFLDYDWGLNEQSSS
tara:strand:- start:239533 stop:240453 length:921 start_codon:yes stop_codon:yes gene_type:complete